MNARQPLAVQHYLHEIPVEEVLAKKRWGREDWIVYALDAMEHGGLGAVTIEELARRAKRTKGSFYAHFDSRDELLEAMLQAWIDFKTHSTMTFDSDLFKKGEFSIAGLLGRLRAGRQTARLNLDIAIREWARLLWMGTGRHLIFIDPKQKALAESSDLAIEAFVRMYKTMATRFSISGEPSWKGHFQPLDAPETSQQAPPTPRKRRRR